MPIPLKTAMERVLDGWRDDIDPAWRSIADAVELDFDAIDATLTLDEWEPIFPTRRGRIFPGAPAGAHMLRAFDKVRPGKVRCVILGQDPYPEPGFSTGRAFEAGNVAAWRELDKMFSKSVRAFTQLIIAARSGDDRYARSFADWPQTLQAIERGDIGLERPDELAQRWVDQNVLLLNSSLTLTRFQVAVDPHQSKGHLPLWRPLMLAILRHLASRGDPLVIIAFGDVATRTCEAAGLDHPTDGSIFCIRRDHPANADAVLSLPNPFALCNEHLARHGVQPINW